MVYRRYLFHLQYKCESDHA